LQELFEDQLACADLVVLNKTDLVDAQTQAQDLIQQELPRVVKMVPSDRGQLDPAVIFGIPGCVEEDLAARPSHHDTEEDHEHDEEINSTHVILNRALIHRNYKTSCNCWQQQEIYR